MIQEEQTAGALGFVVPEEYRDKTANKLLLGAIKKFLDICHNDFEAGWKLILKYDKCSFRSYLEEKEGWHDSVIGFVETMCSQTNQFTLSFPEMIMQNLDFEAPLWSTLDGGMDMLPQALARVVGLDNITFEARVQEIEEVDGKVRIRADTPGGQVQRLFDKVILATPPSAVRLMPKRPRWSPPKEEALRSMYFEALYKIGIRFKTRFWELVDTPTYGGQSTTDLPIRWIVYPSYGLGTKGPGVLLLYSWMTDASLWSSVKFNDRVRCALQNLAEVYKHEKVDLYGQYMAASDMPWAEHNPTGDCMFLPGQFTKHFETAQQPEGNIYFAGEHLSRHHTWIAGALDSARATATTVFKDLQDARPKFQLNNGWIPLIGGPPEKDYDPEEQRRKLIKEAADRFAADPQRFESAFLLRCSGQM